MVSSASSEARRGRPRNPAPEYQLATLDTAEFLRMAVSLGLVAGLVEGLSLLAVFRYGWLYLRLGTGVSIEILWISALVTGLLFLLLALASLPLTPVLPRLPLRPFCLGLLVFLTFADWLSITGRIGPLGVSSLSAGLTVVLCRWFRRRPDPLLSLWRRSFPYTVAAFCLTLLAVEGGLWVQERRATAHLVATPAGAPNVLVIVVDTLRADHVSLYGYPRPTTPNLDRIASQGVVFENAIATAPWTLPSHASMVTGRYPHEHGARGERGLDAYLPTVAEAFRDHGFRTGAFSGNSLYFCRRAGFVRGFLHFEDYFYSLGDILYRTIWGRVVNHFIPPGVVALEDIPERQRAEQINQRALRWIDRDREHPFFLFLNYFDVHEPYVPKQPYRSKFSKAPNPGGLIDDNHPTLSSDELQSEVDAYDGALSYVDEQIGRIFAELRERGLDRSTVVVITSDHGEDFGEHNLLGHRNSLYLATIHVPLIYWGAGRIPAGVRVDRPVSGASLPATVLDLVGAGDQRLFPISSLEQLWKHPEAPNDWQAPISEMEQYAYLPPNYPAYSGWLKTIVNAKWQLILSEKQPPELYDWRSDPKETVNLANTTAGQEIVTNLRAQLRNDYDNQKQNLSVSRFASARMPGQE